MEEIGGESASPANHIRRRGGGVEKKLDKKQVVCAISQQEARGC